ncbi:Disease resistance protein RPM1 [Triticum urartu]|uniref:Disease resistance protein RPM1 n=1 Tax=Triticum urartu TaxID=4572 RepID=M7YG74_TRIUA|nr:Disease resistance protein RPM1 [Triticum urartu]
MTDSGNGSRIIVTTRVEDVACWACHNRQQCIYKMKPLNDQDSKRLFFSRVFGPEHVSPSQYEEVSTEILKRCGGLPLAVITIGGILASRPGILRQDWENIRSYLGVQSATDLTMEGMRRILNLSYMHLPVHLRACCLRLGMHPEDYEIMRDDLVRQWIAEGLVRSLPGLDLEDVARSYFNELINRSLIQPERTVAGDVISCKVHDVIPDVIISKCQEENFMSVVYNSEDMARLHECKPKVCRLFFCSSSNDATNGTISRATGLSKVRSIMSFGGSKYLNSLLFSKYLRVLLIENWGITVDLSDINRLFHLRYLKVTAGNIKLPSELKGLVHLETLELTSDSIPSDVVQLPRLSHLTALCHRLPEGIGNLKLLRTLNGFQLTGCSSEDIKGLGELTNLRELFFVIEDTTEIDDALVSSIEKLRKLRHLRFSHNWYLDNDSLSSLSNPPLLIETLRMKGIITFRIPRWIGDLHCLHHLELYVRQTSTDDIGLLGELPSLMEFKLCLLHFAANGAIIVRTGLFPALEYFQTYFQDEDHELHSAQDDVMAHLCFEVGSMPKLQRLELHLWEGHWGGATPVGIEHLLALQQIKLGFAYCGDSDINEVDRRAESAFRDALQAHPNRHSIRFN